jgi:hypothetical protein
METRRMFANTYNKNFRLSTEYLAGTFAYYTPYYNEFIQVTAGGSATFNLCVTEKSYAKAEFDKLKLHLQDPKYDRFRR